MLRRVQSSWNWKEKRKVDDSLRFQIPSRGEKSGAVRERNDSTKVKFHLSNSATTQKGQTSIFIPKNKLLDHELPEIGFLKAMKKKLKITLEGLEQRTYENYSFHNTRDTLSHRVEWNFDFDFFLFFFSLVLLMFKRQPRLAIVARFKPISHQCSDDVSHFIADRDRPRGVSNVFLALAVV